MMNNELVALGHATLSKVFKDGTIRLVIDVDPSYKDHLGNLLTPDIPVAIARVSNSVMANQTANNLVSKSLYGEQAKQLRLSSFFRTPDVWRSIGSDSDYQAWCRKQPCAYCKSIGNEKNSIEYAHVRRIADGAGTGIKPDYSGIPLCRDHHSNQHQHGESAIGGKEQVDKMKIEHLQRWAWVTLKAKLGYESWSYCPPVELKDWTDKNELTRYLPDCYKK